MALLPTRNTALSNGFPASTALQGANHMLGWALLGSAVSNTGTPSTVREKGRQVQGRCVCVCAGGHPVGAQTHTDTCVFDGQGARSRCGITHARLLEINPILLQQWPLRNCCSPWKEQEAVRWVGGPGSVHGDDYSELAPSCSMFLESSRSLRPRNGACVPKGKEGKAQSRVPQAPLDPHGAGRHSNTSGGCRVLRASRGSQQQPSRQDLLPLPRW